MDIEWALDKLDHFLKLTELQQPPEGTSMMRFSRRGNQSSQEKILDAAPVVEEIIDRVIPGWQDTVPDRQNQTVNRWCQHREAAQRARALLRQREELQEKLGEKAPELNAASLHTWVWQGAKSLWDSGHYREAVSAAARKVNAETQNKVGRRDTSETKLFQESFSTDPPKAGKPRLRVMPDDDSTTYRNVQRGVMAFAEGCFAAIRNPAAHDHEQEELNESTALEQLAAFSVLARWVDAATVEYA